MKISELKQLFNLEVKKAENISKEEAIKVFGNEIIDTDDGLVVEKLTSAKETAPKEIVDKDKKTYVKYEKDEFGEPSTKLTYRSKDNTLLQKEYKEFDYKRIENYYPGTKNLKSSQKYSLYEKQVTEETLYRNDEFNSKKSDIKYGPDGKTIEKEILYERINGQDKPKLSREKFVEGADYLKYENGLPSARKFIRNDNSIALYSSIVEDEQGNKYVEQNEYRPDGTHFSSSKVKDIIKGGILEKTVYARNGKDIKARKYKNEKGEFINERYNESGNLYVKEKLASLEDDAQLKERTVYNKDGSVYISLKYDENGKITDYKKNIRTDNPDYDMFQEDLYNAEMDGSFTMGKTGLCYAASGVKGLVRLEKGRQIINNSIKEDPKTENLTIHFKENNKDYTFTKEQVKESMGRLGTGDPTFTALMLAMEQKRLDEGKGPIDGGFTNETFKALTGDEGDLFLSYVMDEKTLNELQEKLKSKQYVLTAGTPPESADFEFTKKDEKAGMVYQHSYNVIDINSETITVEDPAKKGKVIEVPREKFFSLFEFMSGIDISNM